MPDKPALTHGRWSMREEDDEDDDRAAALAVRRPDTALSGIAPTVMGEEMKLDDMGLPFHKPAEVNGS